MSRGRYPLVSSGRGRYPLDSKAQLVWSNATCNMYNTCRVCMHINCRVYMQNNRRALNMCFTMQPQSHTREKKNRRKFSEQQKVYIERAQILLLALKSDVWEFPAGKVMAGNRVVITCADGYKPFNTRGSRKNPKCLDSRAFQRGISCVPILCPPYAGMCRLLFLCSDVTFSTFVCFEIRQLWLDYPLFLGTKTRKRIW